MPKHSKRYAALTEKIDSSREYSLDEVVPILKEISNTKFDSGIELHVKTGIDVKQSDQHVRGTVSLPNGTGKKQKIAVITSDPEKAKQSGADIAGGEEIIKEIQSGKIDFDVLVAEPSFMPNLAPVAKILGPKGLMPSPKNGTVAEDVNKAITELAKGKIAFKNDDTGNIHILVGRSSFSEDKLKENINTAFDAVKTSRPASVKGSFIKNVSLSTTMGPGIKVSL